MQEIATFVSMKKIIEFFSNLFGKKWEYMPTEYASPVEQLVEAKKEAVKKKVHANPAALAGKKKPVAKKTAKKSAKKKTK